MCIALVSTAHPSYSLILIDNRDEYLRRPTSSPDWWPEPHSHVLGSRDLARAVHGTWMGVTKQGKVAVLTNYREDPPADISGLRSRGAIVNSWLTAPPDRKTSTRDFAEEMISSRTVDSVGGFSLVCGYVNEPLAIISNRSSRIENVTWVATDQGQTIGLSNTAFDDRSWPKIIHGERLMQEAIESHAKSQADEDELIKRLLEVLSTDTLPRAPDDAEMETYLPELRKSIFIPVIGAQDETDRAADEVAVAQAPDRVPVAADPNGALNPAYLHGAYGTQKQTVILVKDNGRVRYFERTLYDGNANAIPIGKGDRSFEFVVEQ